MSEFFFAGREPIPVKAGGAIEAYRVLKANSTTAKEVIHATAEGDAALGASVEKVASGDQTKMMTGAGVYKLTAGAAISAGDEVECAAAGKVITAGGAAARSIGVARTAAAADGDIIEVYCNLPALKGPANS